MKTILVIEDNLDIRENIVEILEIKLYKVLFAENGKTGLETAKKHLPDIILCDIMMPEMDGFQVLAGLKSDNTTSGIPFIFLTASVERSAVEMSKGMGASGYIRKPFQTEELLETIEGLLQA